MTISIMQENPEYYKSIKEDFVFLICSKSAKFTENQKQFNNILKRLQKLRFTAFKQVFFYYWIEDYKKQKAQLLKDKLPSDYESKINNFEKVTLSRLFKNSSLLNQIDSYYYINSSA